MTTKRGCGGGRAGEAGWDMYTRTQVVVVGGSGGGSGR